MTVALKMSAGCVPILFCLFESLKFVFCQRHGQQYKHFYFIVKIKMDELKQTNAALSTKCLVAAHFWILHNNNIFVVLTTNCET